MSSSSSSAPTGSTIRRPNDVTKARFGDFVDERSFDCDTKSTPINSTDLEILDIVVNAGLKLVIWDFDNCLIRYHAPPPAQLKQMIKTGKLEDDFFDVGFFVTLVDELVARGVRVAIASFGHYDNVQLYLDAAIGIPEPYYEKLLFYDRKVVDGDVVVTPVEVPVKVNPKNNNIFHRRNIVTPSLLSFPDGYLLKSGKRSFLKYLVTEANTEPKYTMFFDDDSKNFEFPRPNEFHIPTCVHTPLGFTRYEWTLGVESFLRLRNIELSAEHKQYLKKVFMSPRQLPENLRKQ